jgi:hypothetical protein
VICARPPISAFQDLKRFGFSYGGLFLLQAFRGAAQKQQRPLRVEERFWRDQVF